MEDGWEMIVDPKTGLIARIKDGAAKLYPHLKPQGGATDADLTQKRMPPQR